MKTELHVYTLRRKFDIAYFLTKEKLSFRSINLIWKNIYGRTNDINDRAKLVMIGHLANQHQKLYCALLICDNNFLGKSRQYMHEYNYMLFFIILQVPLPDKAQVYESCIYVL